MKDIMNLYKNFEPEYSLCGTYDLYERNFIISCKICTPIEKQIIAITAPAYFSFESTVKLIKNYLSR